MIKEYDIDGTIYQVEFLIINGRSYAYLIEYNSRVVLDDPYHDEYGWTDRKVIQCIEGIKGLK